MSEFDNKLVEFTAVLDEFAANQRRQALAENKRQKITYVRQIEGKAGMSGSQIVTEFVVEDGADSEEIFGRLVNVDAATDRLRAKVDLAGHYGQMLNKCGAIEIAERELRGALESYAVQNVAHNKSRRIERVGLTERQKQEIADRRSRIRADLTAIDEVKRAAEECRRVLNGKDPFVVLNDEVERRLRLLRADDRAVA